MPSTWIMSHGTAALARGTVLASGSQANGDQASDAPPAVRMRGARRSFDAEMVPVRALRGLDLDVAAGEFVAVMGPSGCGKSTLLNVIAGLDQPDEGSVEVAGERIDGRDEEWLARFRRHHIGVVFQFFSLLDGVSVLDNLVLPGILGGLRRRAAAARGRELLGLLGIGEHGGRLPGALSGGQRQRLAIARALVSLRPGTNVAAAARRLSTAAGSVNGGQGPEFFVPPPPQNLLVVKDVAVLPLALGAFLVLLALGAMGHALTSAVHRRRGELAVLRALGMTRLQSRLVVVTQASVLATVGLAVGVPLGLAIGRFVWRLVALNTPLAYHPPLAFWALVLIGPLALLAANLLAAWPGQRAARLRSAQILRAE